MVVLLAQLTDRVQSQITEQEGGMFFICEVVENVSTKNLKPISYGGFSGSILNRLEKGIKAERRCLFVKVDQLEP